MEESSGVRLACEGNHQNVTYERALLGASPHNEASACRNSRN